MENLETNSENTIQPKLDNKDRAYATGKRKNSIARVWLKRGDGKISVNGKSLDKYFARPVLQMIVNQPLNVVDGESGYEIMATVKGGGLSGQAGAIIHGMSKALTIIEPEHKLILKKAKLTTVQMLKQGQIINWYKNTSPEDRRMKDYSGRPSARAKFYKEMDKVAKAKGGSLRSAEHDSDSVWGASFGTWDDPLGLTGQTGMKFQKDIFPTVHKRSKLA